MGWAGIGIPTMDRRIDIRVEANAALLTAMAARMVGEGSSETLNPHNLMAEIANLVRGHVQGQLQRYGHTSNISVLSRCFDARSLTTAGAESERPKHYVMQPMSLKGISISPFASSALSVPPLSNAKLVKSGGS